MDLGLTGRVALVTGASKGIGAAIADELEAEGARVARSSRSTERFAWDTSDVDGAGPLVDAVEAELGQIDILVCNTGGRDAAHEPRPDAGRHGHREPQPAVGRGAGQL